MADEATVTTGPIEVGGPRTPKPATNPADSPADIPNSPGGGSSERTSELPINIPDGSLRGARDPGAQSGRFGPVRETGDDRVPANGANGASTPDGRQPGRDANGNFLPGADGHVETGGAGFHDINDLNGNGILDGQEHPVDLSHDSPASSDTGTGSGHVGNDFNQGRDRNGDFVPDRPGNSDFGRGGPALRDESRTFLPGAPGGLDLQLPGTGPTFEPGGDGTPDVQGRGPEVVVDPAFPSPPPPDSHNAPYQGDGTHERSQSPVAGGIDSTEVAPAPGLDTFDTGIHPSAVAHAPGADAPAPDVVSETASNSPSAAPADDPSAGISYDDTSPAPDSGSQAASAAIAALAADIPARAALTATDVFDPQAIGDAVSTAVKDTTDEGGANLLERIFDRVRDLLLDSGPHSSPVQLPVQQLPVTEAELESLIQHGSPDALVTDSHDAQPDDDDDDDFDDGL